MKAWIQRVRRGKVTVGDATIGEIGQGYVVLLGVKQGDTEADAKYLADKTAALRIFPDEQGRMNRSIIDVGGSVLAVSQFTLHADTSRGNRPVSFWPPPRRRPTGYTSITWMASGAFWGRSAWRPGSSRP